jgi:tricorn protease
MTRWNFAVTPRAEFRELYLDAWRLERDYFYDRNMQGLDWASIRDRYLPLVDRVSDRDELNDVIAQMVSELSALHIFVEGGDSRKPADQVEIASLGAALRRNERAGGFVVEHIYLHDPDLPDEAPPLARPDSLVREGEVILGIDGEDSLSVSDERALLRGKAGRKVLLRVKSVAGETREVLVTPVSGKDDATSVYAEWEYSRRQKVETDSQSQIGYVHLRAMGSSDIEQWAREFYPVYDRQGLIIDVRHNTGGNIDSWMLGQTAPQGVVLLAAAGGQPHLQHAIRLSRIHRGALRSADSLRRRSLYRGNSAPRTGQDHRREDLGRRDMAFRQQHAGR